MISTAARARAHAAQVVDRVRAGRTLDDALDELFVRLPDGLSEERSLIQEMAYGATRWHFQLTSLTRDLLDKPLAAKDSDLDSLLHIGLYQLLYMRVAPHAAVNETVSATVVLGKDWARGLVNAVLRRALRELEMIRGRINGDETLALATPDWLLARLQSAYPDNWRRIAAAANARAPLTLRVHAGRIERAAAIEKLVAGGYAAHPVENVDSAITLATPAPVDALPGFRDGELSVQDAAAQLAAPLLDARKGQRVLDACAAPGGKAAHLLERTPALQLVALDVDRSRLARIRENFTRLGVHGDIVHGDAATPTDWWDGQPFDRILLDAPCSATGVIRRHPDIRLHRQPRDLERLAATQARLLDSLWPILAPGGKLLYVTCSILPEENRQGVAAFAARQPQARPLPLPHPALAQHARADGLGYQILPGTADMDGFYYAAFEKSGTGPA
jgi:16S rRNA (cytosine967-C5)-methyltransferase